METRHTNDSEMFGKNLFSLSVINKWSGLNENVEDANSIQSSFKFSTIGETRMNGVGLPTFKWWVFIADIRLSKHIQKESTKPHLSKH